MDIREKVKREARDIIIELLREQFRKNSSRYEISKIVEGILSINIEGRYRLAIVDTGAELPSLPEKGELFDISQGWRKFSPFEEQVFRSGMFHILGDGWVKEIK